MSASLSTTPASSALLLDTLVKDFPAGRRGLKLRAVDHVSLEIRPGEVFGLLGPNGSGKSTTLKIVLGLVEATSGHCEVFGRPGGSREARRQIGFLPEAPYFHRFLTGREVVELSGRLSGIASHELRGKAEAALEQTGLAVAAHRRTATYSKGMLQRLGMAQAIVHEPPLLILDEPTAGVDPLGADAIGELIGQQREAGKTIILCSHLLDQVEQLCSRVAILHQGRLLLEGRVDTLTAQAETIALHVRGLPAEAGSELAFWLQERGASVEHEGPVRRSLQDVFRDELQRFRN
ncbi:MAG: ABC transporter ATP-binding protein [Opitutales bacterium]